MTEEELEMKLDKVRTEGGIEVMKASAGSGKTYSLSREYIRILLTGSREERHYHRHILAVTFTNKATESMKSKIISDLHLIASDPEKCKYRDFLVEKCGFSGVAELQKAARTALNDLLNDYSAFSVSTIDKFFQRTLKAFAREIDHNSEYRVELDRDSLVEEAADRVLDGLSTENDSLLKWLSESTIERLENGEKYKIERPLKEFAKGYLSPEYEKKAKEKAINEEAAFSEENLRSLVETCRSIITGYDEPFKKAVKDASDAMRAAPYYEFINSYLKGRIDKFLTYKGGSIDFPVGKDFWTKACSDFSKVIGSKYKGKVSESEIERMTELIRTIDSFSGKPYALRRTASMLFGQVHVFRTAEALRKEYDSLLVEKNVLGLDDTNSILKDIIDGNEAPFIYEKTGTRYKHFLLDEFQDTSVVQWECFKPLLKNSIAEGWYNLVVGDVKQSIYRWRDADWRILGEQVEKDMMNVVVNPLKTNWRSAANIVRFNNSFHAWTADTYGKNDLYLGVEQNISEAESVPGCVEMVFCSEKAYMEHIEHAVRDALSRNFSLKDIAVIVRTNELGASIAEHLTRNGIAVVTDDSLKVGSSLCVRRVVAGLTMIDDPDDTIGTFEAIDFDMAAISGCRSLFEMADALMRQLPVEDVNKDSLFVLAFMDLIRDFSSSNGNSLHAFLKQWKESGMSRMISCPKDTDAVTIITIHKSKGLDYPFVILPIPPYCRISGADKVWDAPQTEGTDLERCEPALYNVCLSKDSLFEESYLEENSMAQVDYINTWYVAMTRPKQEMCIVSTKPSGNSPISQLLREFAKPEVFGFRQAAPPAEIPVAEGEFFERFIYGEPVVRSAADGDMKSGTKAMDVLYASSGETGIKGKVRISDDAAEYFLGDGSVSNRKRGIILHGIMQRINSASDIHGAVDAAVREGGLRSEEAVDTEALLSKALESVSGRGWFGEGLNGVLSERDILSADEGERRPDRVIVRDASVDIIDYKFGDAYDKYKHQVGRYIRLYRQMGYHGVKAYLWYVLDGKIEEFC